MHRLQPGHYVAPLLCAGSTSLPFAAGLELFSGSCNEYGVDGEDFSLPELPESDGLLSLQYILDGRAQVNFCARCPSHHSSTCLSSLPLDVLGICHTQEGQKLFLCSVCPMQVSGDGELLMAQAGDTLLSRKSQGVLQVAASAASMASASEPQPAAELGPTSPQGTSQLVRYCHLLRLPVVRLHVTEPSTKSCASAPQLLTVDTNRCSIAGAVTRARAITFRQNA